MNGAKQADGASVALDAATTMPQQLSAYAADLTAVYHVTELLHQRTSFLRPSIPSVPVSSSKTTSAALAVPGKIEPPDSSQHPVDKISELRDVVAKLAANAHHMAGAQYLHLHNVSAAVNSFRQSLLVHSPVYTQRVMAAKYGNGVNRKDLPEQQMVLDDFISVKRTHETCTTLHW